MQSLWECKSLACSGNEKEASVAKAKLARDGGMNGKLEMEAGARWPRTE